MEHLDLDTVAQELRTKADELRARITELTKIVASDETISFGKRIGDGTIQAIQQMEDTSTAESLQRLLNEVTAAQARLASGDYGLCVVCGEKIPDERLEFRPWAATCVRHAA